MRIGFINLILAVLSFCISLYSILSVPQYFLVSFTIVFFNLTLQLSYSTTFTAKYT